MDEVKRNVFDLAADGLPSVSEIGSVEIHRTLPEDTMHTHGDSIEIIYCRRGSHVYESLGRQYRLTPGRLFISRPREPHCITSQSKWLATYYVVVRLPRIGDREFGLTAAEAKWLRHGFASLPDRLLEASPEIPQLFRTMLDVCSTMPTGAAERVLHLRLGVLGLLCEVLRRSSGTKQAESIARIGMLVDEMRTHPEQSYPEGLLLERCAMSSSRLNAAFKEATGLPPHAFLISCRIARAKELLAETDTPIGAISDQLGFPSSKHFANIFRQLAGTTPSDFRSGPQRTVLNGHSS